MVKILKKIIIISLLLLSNYSGLISQVWHFEYEPEYFPSENNNFQKQGDWRYNKVETYKDYAVYLHNLDGFALYKEKVWTYYTSEIIKEKIINKTDVNNKYIKQVFLLDCMDDNQGHLWLMAGNYILRFDGESFYYYDSLHLKSGEKKSIFYNNFLISSYDRVLMRSSFKGSNETRYKMLKFIFECNKEENKFVELIDYDSQLHPHTNILHLVDSKNRLFLGPNLSKETGSSDGVGKESIFQLIQNDTIIEITNKNQYYIYKFMNGKCVEIDSNFNDEVIKMLERLQILKNIGLNKKINVDYYNNTLYVLINFPGLSNPIFSTYQPRFCTYNLSNNEFRDYEIPQIPNDTIHIFPNDINRRVVDKMRVDSKGNVLFTFPGIGTYHYYPNKAKVDDDGANDDAFLVGARIWKLYPNPTSNQCRAEFHLSRSGSKGVKILISDIQGKIYKDLTKSLQYDYKMREGTVDFDISDLPSGSYYFLITSPNANDLQRVILEK